MSISTKEIGKFVLVNVILPVVLSLIVAYTYGKIKAKSETKTKEAVEPTKKVLVTTVAEEEVEVTTAEI